MLSFFKNSTFFYMIFHKITDIYIFRGKINRGRNVDEAAFIDIIYHIFLMNVSECRTSPKGSQGRVICNTKPLRTDF